jgi:hypothetical protein
MFLDGHLIKRIDLSRLGDSSSIQNLPGHNFDRSQLTTGQEQPGTLAREGPRNRAANSSSRSIDHGILVFKQHIASPDVFSSFSSLLSKLPLLSRLFTNDVESCPVA